MKSRFSLSIGLFALSVAAQSDQEPLTAAVEALPSCSYEALTDAMGTYGCDPSDIDIYTFGCICSALPVIIPTVAAEVGITSQCIKEFSQNFSDLCGVVTSEDGVSGDDLYSAIGALSSEVGGTSSAETSTTSVGTTRTHIHLTGTPSTTATSSEAETTSDAPAISTTSESTLASEALTTSSATRTIQVTVTAGASATTNGAFAAAPTKIGNLVGPVIAAIAVLI